MGFFIFGIWFASSLEVVGMSFQYRTTLSHYHAWLALAKGQLDSWFFCARNSHKALVRFGGQCCTGSYQTHACSIRATIPVKPDNPTHCFPQRWVGFPNRAEGLWVYLFFHPYDMVLPESLSMMRRIHIWPLLCSGGRQNGDNKTFCVFASQFSLIVMMVLWLLMQIFHASDDHDDRIQKQLNDDNNDNKDHIYHISMTWIVVSDDVENLFGSLISKVWANLLSLLNCYVLSMACGGFHEPWAKRTRRTRQHCVWKVNHTCGSIF